ncbi:MAG: hemerythrin domain-containing protein [Candidatus Omnitrophota bacterium]|jgi:hemerythrin-like domain-containing protein
MKYKGFAFSRAGWQLHMMPAGYLMIEHRLIERMVRLMATELTRMRKRNKADPGFLGKAVDFIRNYADQCHHGKEEEILFREMAKKKLDPRHRGRMNQLVREHRMGRRSVKRLVAALAVYKGRKIPALRGIKRELKWLAEFYPQHIVKEDKGFFIPAMSYFTKKEQQRMLLEFCRFDGSSIQKIYRRLIEIMEKKYR